MPPESRPSKFHRIIVSQVFDVVRVNYGFEATELVQDKGTKTTEARRVAAYLFQEAGIPKTEIGRFLGRASKTVEDLLRGTGTRMESDDNFRNKVHELGDKVDIIRLRRGFVKIRPDLKD